MSRWVYVLLLVIGLAGCSPESEQKPEPVIDQSPQPQQSQQLQAAGMPIQYTLSIDPQVLPDGRVRLDVSDNIPGTIEVMVGLSLQGQAGDDGWIGKDERVRLIDGQGVVTFATDDLPKGTYDAEVSFYPRWGFQDDASRATGISDNLSASSSIALAGSGESSSDVQSKENGQRWVMENVTMGDPWRPSEWTERFGEYEELPVDRGNPEILKAYYFPSIDTTLIVNTLKTEITVWRLGKAHS